MTSGSVFFDSGRDQGSARHLRISTPFESQRRQSPTPTRAVVCSKPRRMMSADLRQRLILLIEALLLA